MNWRLAWLAAIVVCVLFFGIVGLAYFLPNLATHKFLGRTMLAVGLLVVVPTLVGLFWHLRRQGLRVSKHTVQNTPG